MIVEEIDMVLSPEMKDALTILTDTVSPPIKCPAT
jgi:hypothetical protein